MVTKPSLLQPALLDFSVVSQTVSCSSISWSVGQLEGKSKKTLDPPMEDDGWLLLAYFEPKDNCLPQITMIRVFVIESFILGSPRMFRCLHLVHL